MKIVVCVRKLVSGDLNPFDACCYEAALRIKNADITLLSMGPMSCKDMLLSLTRLGAKKAILLTDPKLAGSDTLATSYALSLAIKKLSPDLILCGRQTIDGDTGQVGPELATMLDIPLITNVMKLEEREDKLYCETRQGEAREIPLPSLLTVERINTLRLPSIRSKVGEIEILTAKDIGAEDDRIGLKGSPTKVLESYKNQQDRRKCKFISKEELSSVINEALSRERIEIPADISQNKLKNLWIIGEAPRKMAETVSDGIKMIPLSNAEELARKIREEKPEAVLFASDLESKKTAPQVAAMLKTGLCADCTRLETDGTDLFMYRPAFSGDIIAKIKCTTRPQMATVRTVESMQSRITVGVGYGAKNCIDKAEKFAEAMEADVAASRKLVDNGYMPYQKQVGLTGRSVSPDIYIAIGISGAVHHIAGIKSSGVIIAINSDKNAEIFDYADYGIVADIEEVL